MNHHTERTSLLFVPHALIKTRRVYTGSCVTHFLDTPCLMTKYICNKEQKVSVLNNNALEMIHTYAFMCTYVCVSCVKVCEHFGVCSLQDLKC